MNIIQSSFASSGTMVFANITMDIAKSTMFLGRENKFIQSLVKQSSDMLKDSDISFARLGAVDFFENRRIEYSFLIYDKKQKYSYGKTIDLTDIFEDIYNTNDNFCIVTHASPARINANDSLLGNTKKIYILRDFRDVYHSHIRSVDKNEWGTQELKSISEDKDFLILSRYFDIDMFLFLLKEWKRHVTEYLASKNEYFLLKYENLTKNPENTILNLANSLNIEINDEKIKEVIKKYMFKDVWLFGKPSDDFKHFNKAQNSWREYFPPTMQKLICDEIGDLLIELGYEKDKNWACDNKNLTKEQNCIEKAYKDNMFLSLEVFIDHINELLQNKRVAFYGAGEYFSLVANKITNIDRAIFVIDGNKSKYGQKICGVEVVSEDDIALRFDEFDIVLACVAPQYQDDITQKLKTLKIAKQNIYNIFNILIYNKLKNI